MRVHELAKELEKSNKDIISFLTEKKIEVKSHMSTLTDEQADMVKKAFAGRPKAQSKPAAPAAGAETTSKAEGTGTTAAPPKKKKIIAVYNVHNSQTGIKDPRGERRANGARSQSARASQSQGGARPGVPVRPVRAGQTAAPVGKPDTGEKSREAQSAMGAPAPAAREATVPAKTEAENPTVQKPEIRESQGVQGTVKPASRETQSMQESTKPVGAQRTPETTRPVGRENPVSQGGARPVAREGQPAQGGTRPVGRDGQRPMGASGPRPGMRDGQGGPRRDGQGQGGQRPYNRDGQGGQRPYSRDGQGGPRRDGQGQGGQRPYNRDGQGGQRPYNRDGQGQGGQRPYNRDGQGGQRPYSRDGQGGARPYNRDGQGGGYRKDFDKDGDNRRPQGQRGPGGGRTGGRSMDIPAAPLVENRKTENRRVENKTRDDRKEKSRYNDDWSGRTGQAGRTGSNNRTNQNNRPGQKGRGKGTPAPVAPPAPKKEDNTPKVIEIPEMISIHDLAEKMKIQPSVLIKKLFLAGKMVTLNSELDFESAGELAMEMNFDPVPEEKEDVIAKMLEDQEENGEGMISRPPVVCVMGHVDHGKTSLLDAIRDTHVIDREAGGITQHIGAYVVTINDQKITFLDTPGHEAFTAMRMRGANSTDIAILVVAADDGVMPQTVEAISHAKAAGIEIIVAINKVDKPSANVDRVKQELMEHELVAEEWGGSTVCVPVSAKSHEGIDQLLEMILLTAEMLELKANPDRSARGLVIEAELDKGKGSVATVLVQKGTLRVGDPIAVGSCYGKVRAMMDDNGRRVKEAGPSQPVEILGLSDVPKAGEIFVSPATEKEARAFAETYIKESREKLLEDTKLKMSLDDLYSQIQSGNLKELNIIVKADVQGSVEAVKQSLLKLSNEEVVVKIVHGGVGAINESDVNLASASNAIIIGFNVRPDATAKEIAEREKVDLRQYRVIYDAINDVEAAMKGMLDPVFEEKILGHAEIRQLFKASGVGTIAGSYVLDGVFQRNCSCRITREGEQIFDGALASLKRFKDDVKEVKAGYECGLVFEKFNDLKELDIVEAYTMVEVPR
ncbi:MAG: translation initiation factor IF-2 [Lachnospiraceae bacterium]|nr:translation initiation factor IF-2 [Lachnospiraceae bacterium]